MPSAAFPVALTEPPRPAAERRCKWPDRTPETCLIGPFAASIRSLDPSGGGAGPVNGAGRRLLDGAPHHLRLEHDLLPGEAEHEPVAGHEPVVAAAVTVESLSPGVE